MEKAKLHALEQAKARSIGRQCRHERIMQAGQQDICVSIVPIFNHLDQDQMLEIAKTVTSCHYKKGEMVYRSGDAADSLYVVREGGIRIFRLSASGREQLVRILRRGEFTGEMALFTEQMHDSYAEAVRETAVCRIDRIALQGILQKYPAISLKILAELSRRLEESERQTARFVMEKTERRLAVFLAEYSETGGLEFTLPMSKKDIASYLGTTPETISRKLCDLENAGCIRQKPKKRIEILDRVALRQI